MQHEAFALTDPAQAQLARDGFAGLQRGGIEPIGFEFDPRVPFAVEKLRVLKETQTADSLEELPGENPLRGRVNLLNWDGKGMPDGIFPGDKTGAPQ